MITLLINTGTNHTRLQLHLSLQFFSAAGSLSCLCLNLAVGTPEVSPSRETADCSPARRTEHLAGTPTVGDVRLANRASY